MFFLRLVKPYPSGGGFSVAFGIASFLKSFARIRGQMVPFGKKFQLDVSNTTKYQNTLRETNVAPENRPPHRNVAFQPSIFRRYVSFREGTCLISDFHLSQNHDTAPTMDVSLYSQIGARIPTRLLVDVFQSRCA